MRVFLLELAVLLLTIVVAVNAAQAAGVIQTSALSAQGISAATFEGYGVSASLSAYYSALTKIESNGCGFSCTSPSGTYLGFYQNSLTNVISEGYTPTQYANPSIQIQSYPQYIASQWNSAQNNPQIMGLIGQTVTYGGVTTTITQSSILAACQLGCGKLGALANYAKTGDCSASASGDGSGTSACTFLIVGSGYDVSAITHMAADASGTALVSGAATPAASPSDSSSDPNTCVSPDLGNSIQQTAQASAQQAMAVQQNVFKSLPQPNVQTAYCIQKALDAYALIRAIVQGVSMVVAALVAIVNEVISYVCNYVVSAIDYALSQLCIPMPPLNLGLNLNGGFNGTCDGYQLIGPASATPYQFINGFPSWAASHLTLSGPNPQPLRY